MIQCTYVVALAQALSGAVEVQCRAGRKQVFEGTVLVVAFSALSAAKHTVLLLLLDGESGQQSALAACGHGDTNAGVWQDLLGYPVKRAGRNAGEASEAYRDAQCPRLGCASCHGREALRDGPGWAVLSKHNRAHEPA